MCEAAKQMLTGLATWCLEAWRYWNTFQRTRRRASCRMIFDHNGYVWLQRFNDYSNHKNTGPIDLERQRRQIGNRRNRPAPNCLRELFFFGSSALLYGDTQHIFDLKVQDAGLAVGCRPSQLQVVALANLRRHASKGLVLSWRGILWRHFTGFDAANNWTLNCYYEYRCYCHHSHQYYHC